jgi:NADPH-dependent 2,4-dienoyl-CoA reductase/sulfur reductase-like enzyme
VVAGLATADAITNPDNMFENAGIDLIVDRASQVDPKEKNVKLSDGRKLTYDKLILGMGASPVVPPIKGSDLNGVFTLRDLTDAERIRRFLEERKVKRLVFIGAGFINLELAALLSDSKPGHYDVTIIESLNHALPLMLDVDIAERLQGYLVEKSFEMKMNSMAVEILGQDDIVTGLMLDTGEKVEADMIMLSVGVRANLELASDIGLDIGKFGIKVNRFLETSNPDILAAGDCVEKEHFILKKPVPGQLRGPAVIQGRLAAKRLAGYEIPFPGVLNNSAVKLFEKSMGSTGLTESMAQDSGINTVSAVVDSRSKHGMIPGVKPWTLKLIFDRQTQRLIGGQIISDSESPVKEIDTVNALILGEKTISDLTTLMCAGNPDCSSEPSMEPITVAAEQCLMQIR